MNAERLLQHFDRIAEAPDLIALEAPCFTPRLMVEFCIIDFALG